MPGLADYTGTSSGYGKGIDETGFSGGEMQVGSLFGVLVRLAPGARHRAILALHQNAAQGWDGACTRIVLY